MDDQPVRRLRFPQIEPRVVSDDTTLTYHLRTTLDRPVPGQQHPGYVTACGVDVVGVLEPLTHAAVRGLTLCPDCAR
jgi:hypothetical protein